jgi:hypothetical protein
MPSKRRRILFLEVLCGKLFSEIVYLERPDLEKEEDKILGGFFF